MAAPEGGRSGTQGTRWGLMSVIGEGPAPEGVNEAGEWYPETLLLSDPIEPFEP